MLVSCDTGIERSCKTFTVLHAQIADKYEANLDAQARDWINQIVGTDIPIDGNPTTLQEALRDGVILCNLINKLAPGSVPKINSTKMAFKMVCLVVVMYVAMYLLL